MKINSLSRFFLPVSFVLLLLSLISCGGGSNPSESAGKDSLAKIAASKDDFAEKCKAENAIAATIKDYHYQMSGKYQFETGNFEVKQSSITWVNDSTVELKLSNYAGNELVGDRKDDQVDISVSFNSKNGKKITEGVYPYHDYESDLYSNVNMVTSKGTVWFNWNMGMPKEGNVVLNYISKDKICGKFELAVENSKSENIGTVRLNGTFAIK